ncbi:hypothetical protein URH17368_1803 [Alicyclobacillus hesperidum URH17-3-68]|nr:hypothetical protein URH17368_1803 [Alicyclobacillus hesperidum URH17-3-68]
MQQDTVSAEHHELSARQHAVHDIDNLGVDKRFAACNGNGGRAALLDRLKAIFRCQAQFEHFFALPDLSATGTRQVANFRRLEHQHHGITFDAFDLVLGKVLDHVYRRRQRLSCHPNPLLVNPLRRMRR